MLRFLKAVLNLVLFLFLWVWFLPYFLYASIFVDADFGKKWAFGDEFLLDDLIVSTGYYVEAGVICCFLNWVVVVLMPIITPFYFLIDMFQRRKQQLFYKVFTGKCFILDI